MDLVNEENVCSLPEYPISTYGAVAGVLGNMEIVCGGGYDFTNKCFNVITGKEAPFTLQKARFAASAVTIKDKFIVFGGQDEREYNLYSYEIITEQSQTQKSMPFTWFAGCSIAINETTVMLMGGTQNAATTDSKTWFLNLLSEEWIQGPTMNEARLGFGCGLFETIDSIAVFGGEPDKASTELLNVQDGEFRESKKVLIFLFKT